MGTKSRRPKYYKKFDNQRSRAIARGIEWKLSFEEWWIIWKSSGHWKERGRRSYQYCMARFSDEGAYEIGNVRIITNKENRAEMKCSIETRQLMRLAKLGKKLTEEHKKKIGLSGIGKHVGKQRSLETKTKIRGSKNSQAILTESQVINIINSTKKQKDLAIEYGVSKATICSIKKGNRWKHLNGQETA